MSASEIHHSVERGAANTLAAMPGSRARGLLAAPAIAVVLAVAGCGGGGAGDGGIPPDTAEAMLDMTQQIEDASLPEECDTAQETTTALRGEAEAVETAKTREALDAMITRLDENIDADCEGLTSPDAETEEPEAEEPVDPVETEPPPEEVEPPPEEDVEPPPEEDTEEPPTPEQPPSEGGGQEGPAEPPSGDGGGGAPSGGIEEEG
jgi:outer membrane biosynthesis protein TonB